MPATYSAVRAWLHEYKLQPEIKTHITKTNRSTAPFPENLGHCVKYKQKRNAMIRQASKPYLIENNAKKTYQM